MKTSTLSLSDPPLPAHWTFRWSHLLKATNMQIYNLNTDTCRSEVITTVSRELLLSFFCCCRRFWLYLCQLVERIQDVSLKIDFMLHQFGGQPALCLPTHVHHLAARTRKQGCKQTRLITSSSVFCQLGSMQCFFLRQALTNASETCI